MPEDTPLHVVFVHGLFSSDAVWESFASRIADDPEVPGHVRVHRFSYYSPLRRKVYKEIPSLNNLADRLGTFLLYELSDAPTVVVTHSMGGLITQRFLARMLKDDRGAELRQIERIVMYACPNFGSDYQRTMRDLVRTLGWRNPQEAELLPLTENGMEVQEAVLDRVVKATEHDKDHCPIKIIACAGVEDRVVKAHIAHGLFPAENRRTVDGDHSSIIQVSDDKLSAYRIFRKELDEVLAPRRNSSVARPVVVEPTPAEQELTLPPFGRRNTQLVGRDQLLSEVFADQSSHRVRVLAGPGGIGKSRIALEGAHRARELGAKVWWVSMDRINSRMREVAEHLDIPQLEIARAWGGQRSAPDLVWEYLNQRAEPWLLVFDNADDPRKLGTDERPVPDGTGWLREPVTGTGMVIVTSRVADPAIWERWNSLLVVPPLSDADGARMLVNMVGEDGGSVDGAARLSRQLGGNPELIYQTAKYLKSVLSDWRGQSGIIDFDGYRRELNRRSPPPSGDDHD